MSNVSTILMKASTLIAMVLCVGPLGVSIALADTIAACTANSQLLPADTVFPSDCTGSEPGTLLAFMVSPFIYTTSSGTNTGSVESAVYSDGGTLDFYYQVANDASSTTALARMTATTFGNFTTNVGYISNGSTLGGTSFVDGTNAPITADANVNGSVNGFSFYPPTGPPTEISAGEQSYVLIISTNATGYDIGDASVIDGGAATVAAFQPSVPEPASFALLGLGLAGLAGLRRRIRH